MQRDFSVGEGQIDIGSNSCPPNSRKKICGDNGIFQSGLGYVLM